MKYYKNMNMRSIYELTVDELRTIIIEKKIDTEAVRYKSSNKKTGVAKGEIKKSKAVLIKHILKHSENGEIYTLGDDEIYQKKKKEPRKERKGSPPEIQEPEPPEPEPEQEPSETMDSLNRKLDETINKLQISIKKTESLCINIWLFYIVAGICVLNYLV